MGPFMGLKRQHGAERVRQHLWLQGSCGLLGFLGDAGGMDHVMLVALSNRASLGSLSLHSCAQLSSL